MFIVNIQIVLDLYKIYMLIIMTLWDDDIGDDDDDEARVRKLFLRILRLG